MPFESFVYQITAAGGQALQVAPFLIGAYIVWGRQASRTAPIVAVR